MLSASVLVVAARAECVGHRVVEVEVGPTGAVVDVVGGAVVGVLLGVALTGPVGNAVNVPAHPSLAGIALAFGSALVVGVLAGYWPARQAARLDPVEALRYE